MQQSTTYQHHPTLVSMMRWSARPLAMVSVVFALVVFAGYLLGIEQLYRPVLGGPATNPLTAICILVVGIVVTVTQLRHRNPVLRWLLVLVILLTGVRIFDVLWHSHVTAIFTPFQSQVGLELASGKQNAMGLNSAIMLLSLAVSLGLIQLRRIQLSQFLGFIALGIAMVALCGHLYGMVEYYGQMSLITVANGLLLSVATLGLTARKSALRVMLSSSSVGNTARLKVLLFASVAFFLGYIFRDASHFHRIDRSLALLVIALIWVFILFTANNAMAKELLEMKRRKAERNARLTNVRLRAALKEIETLKGIIPICAYCHSIRNDAGDWEILEAYLQKRTEASFTHSICPSCLEKEKQKYHHKESE